MTRVSEFCFTKNPNLKQKQIGGGEGGGGWCGVGWGGWVVGWSGGWSKCFFITIGPNVKLKHFGGSGVRGGGL